MSAGALVLAAGGPVQDSDVSPGVLGFVVVAVLGVATYLLIRSMNRQMRKIDLPADRADDATERTDAADDDQPPPGTP